MTGPKEIKAGLLANLVEANMAYNVASEKKRTLTDGELLSNTFIFLLAGQESSAHTLCFTSLLLALHPEIQMKILREVTNLWPDGAPTPDSFTTHKESMPRLEYTTAVIRETIRMFPPAPRLSKNVTTDTCVKVKIFDSHSLEAVREVDFPIKAGTDVVLDISGLHMNPLLWGDDVEDFKPERFIDTDGYRWPREAFGGFSFGARICIGQRFAFAELVCVIALLIRRYEILVPVSLERKTVEEKKRHMLAWVPAVTATPVNAQVRVKERNN
jgi:cytochrome P450